MESREAQRLLDAVRGDPTTSILYVEGDINVIPFREEQFDWVLCTRVLSHTPDLTPVFKELARVLKRGEECLISHAHFAPRNSYIRMSTNKKNIRIEAHEHSGADFKRAVSHVQGLQLLSLDEYRFADLRWKPPTWKPRTHANAAIFYVGRLKKL